MYTDQNNLWFIRNAVRVGGMENEHSWIWFLFWKSENVLKFVPEQLCGCKHDNIQPEWGSHAMWMIYQC